MQTTKRTVNGNRRVERRNRDDEVIAAAISIMSRRGYPATPIQEIADQVGILKGSLYHYFDSKEELLFRILQEAHTEADRIMAEAEALDVPAFEKLTVFLKNESHWLIRNVDLANIYFSEARHLSSERKKEFAHLGRTFRSHIHQLIRHAQEDGEVREDIPTPLLTEYVIGALNSIRDWPQRQNRAHSPEVMAETFAKLTCDAIHTRSEVDGPAA